MRVELAHILVDLSDRTAKPGGLSVLLCEVVFEVVSGRRRKEDTNV